MIARIFPRKTEATPTDALCFFGEPPDEDLDIIAAHVSVTFSYDRGKAEKLAESWSRRYPTKIGGVAFGDAGADFIPGRYLKPGYTITSRGCPNTCWFCDVWRREGAIRELPVVTGNNILDSNLLACSERHIKRVFEMLKSQKNIQFTGGLEAKKLKPWHLDHMRGLKVAQIFFAYDTPDDLEPLINAGRMLHLYNYTRYHCRCYVLIGHPRDDFAAAEKRLMETWKAGFMPMAMLWKNNAGDENPGWRKLQRQWCRPAITKQIVLEKLIGAVAE